MIRMTTEYATNLTQNGIDNIRGQIEAPPATESGARNSRHANNHQRPLDA